MKKYLIFAFFLTSLHSASAFANPSFLFTQRDANYNRFVTLHKVKVESKNQIRYQERKFKLGKDGIYRSSDTSELRIAADYTQIEYRLNSWSSWTSVPRASETKEDCLRLDGRPICKGMVVIIPRQGSWIPQFFEIKSFLVDAAGNVTVSQNLESLRHLTFESFEGFEVFDINEQIAKCAKGRVCIGDTRQGRNQGEISLGLKYEEYKILGFSKNGVVGRSVNRGVIEVKEMFLTDSSNIAYTDTYPATCGDITPNQKLAFQEKLFKSAVQESQELADYFLSLGSHWKSENSTCVFSGVIQGWAATPIK